MSEVVERILDESVPELLELVRLSLLSEEERREVVRRRRAMEVRLLRRDVQRSDYLRYVAYELQLQLLLRKRAVKKKLAPKKAKKIDGHMSRRIVTLYDRAVRKIRFDEKLWLHYARHCARNASTRATGQVFARALALLPTVEDLWITAAAWQFDSVGDVKAARSLSQRGLRMNPQSTSLWIEYFRLEVHCLSKLLRRRQSLGIEATPNPGESEAKESELRTEDNESFWSGSIPLIVLENSLRTIRNEAERRRVLTSCHDIVVDDGLQIPDSLQKNIAQKLREIEI